MGRNRWLIVACLVPACILAACGALWAEVSAEIAADTVNVLILGVIEDPDPIPQSLWTPVRDIDPQLYLNPTGALRDDGRPDIAIDPVDHVPHVVWAYDNGSDHDIAYSRWEVDHWSPPEFLTASSVDEIDPRIFVDDSRTLVVWWETATNTIRLVERQEGDAWGPTEVVVDEGMCPSVASWGGTVFVASERPDGEGSKDIVLSMRLEKNYYDSDVLRFGSSLGPPLEVVLHSEQGLLWMDWRESATDFAYAEYGGSEWSTAVTVPLSADTWVGREETRLSIRTAVLSAD